MVRAVRTVAALAVASLIVSTAACTSTVGGTAVRAQGDSAPATPVLGARDLDDILLDDGELNELLGARLIEVTDEVDEMTDDADGVSAPECLGALYTAEVPVYEGTGYRAVLTRLASEPEEDYEHWVEETAVVLPSAEAAENFVGESAQTWSDCAGRSVSISDGEDWYDWELGEAVHEGGILSQKSSAVDTVQWECEHAIAAASNVVVEASVCAERIGDEAITLITEMVAKAAEL
jgi:PknH-like extracellular domain